jgi:hypothetical protein
MKREESSSSLTPQNLIATPKAVIRQLRQLTHEAADKDKRRIIQARCRIDFSKRPKEKSIPLTKILRLPAFFRFDTGDQYEDLRGAKRLDCPQVVTIPGTKHYALIDGERRVGYYREQGKSDIKCLVLGEASCFSQMFATRATVVTKLSKPFSCHELAAGLLILRKQLLRDFGEDAFFRHGGRRKGKTLAQTSITEYLASSIGMKKSAVQALLKFGREVGIYALMGLHQREETRNLSLRQINKLNGRIKKGHLRERVQQRISELEEAGENDEEMIKQAGGLAANFILSRKKQNKDLDTKKHEEDDDTEQGDEASEDMAEEEQDQGEEDADQDGEHSDSDEDQEESAAESEDDKEAPVVTVGDLRELLAAHVNACETLGKALPKKGKLLQGNRKTLGRKVEKFEESSRKVKECLHRLLKQELQ